MKCRWWLFVVVVVFLLFGPVRASGWDDGNMSAGFWVMIGLSGVIVAIFLLLVACWCCMPIRGVSERFDALPGEQSKKNDALYGTPQAYDAAMHRVTPVPVYSLRITNKNE